MADKTTNNPHPGVIPGYTYGQTNGQRSPLTEIELQQLKDAVLFTEEDERYLRLAGRILDDQIEDLLDDWFALMATKPQLARFFADYQGQANPEYVQSVRRRWAQWVRDTCSKPYDRDWLEHMHELGMRHHRTKKNKTDGVESVQNISYRYLVAFIFPIVYTIRPYLANKGHNSEMVEKMYNSWFKSIVMQTALWSAPYVKPEDY